MPQIRSIIDLKNINEISDICHIGQESIFISKNGYEDLVVISIETYKEMLDAAAISQACCWRGATRYTALAALWRKHFG